ncbi:MAG: 3-dehydroquinate synthase [Desulfatitalea sp.]|nr:3-dehydroquinate synthase [Desulfatitalea sp.]NNK02406.1 3-dehydroquinate synthase [Desulfatitalea sp.]
MVGERLDNLAAYLPAGRTIIITDENVRRLYGDRFPNAEVITIGCGEQHKTLESLAGIYDRLIQAEADRTAFIVGIGGGIVGDVTGFAASTYMRGVRFGFVATSLLAQVDATVGGKNGVNFKGYKNMVGVFNQPDFVIIDIGLLKTLPDEEIACGLAEIVKHACIADPDYFDFIEQHCEPIAELDEGTMLHLVHRSVAIKAGVVNQDEREAGERRKLNFGHTLGHAFEKTLGISHGAAVSAGMVMAAELSVDQKRLTVQAATRIRRLLARLNLPTHLEFDREAVFNALKKDKKRVRTDIHFILLERLGKAVVATIGIDALGQWLMGR